MLVCTSCTGHSDCKITRKQVDTAHQQFGMNTNDADNTNTVKVANITENAITATQNVAYGQLPPGTDDYDYL